MVFAPEDKRAWQNSEIMAELEKVARATNLLDNPGPPPEAFQPIPEKEARSWEEEDEPLAADFGALREAELSTPRCRLMDEIERMACQLAGAGHIKAAYRLERALAAIKDIAKGG